MDLNLINFKDKVVLITGGAAGVGAGLARHLLAENARLVVILDIAEKVGNALESELRANYGSLRAKFIKCDIADEQELYSAYRHVVDKYQNIDVVVNNAAVASKNPNLNRRMIEVNLTATINSTLKAIDVMEANNGGSIVNVSSLQALTSTCCLPVYSATKSAVIEFSRSLARELERSESKIRVITVCLGPTDTAILHRGSLGHIDQSAENTEANHKQRVSSAAIGLLEVIKRGSNSTVWVIANDKPPVNITEDINKSQMILKQCIY